MDWLWSNREWVFSGVGVAVASGLIAWVLRRRTHRSVRYKQKQSGGTKSTNIQIGSVGRDDREP